ncbi:hypothetical protein ACFQ7W_01610 [Streptomyces niveus]|uniref:hypothetical protein n=1 Tax=Streptomyces niveus TaxID=193462 RepID=UPI0036C6FB0A
MVSAGSPSSQNRTSSTGVLIRSSAHAGGDGSGKAGGSSRSNGGTSDGGGCNSSVFGTKVLMAEGSTKAIEKVKVGDKVGDTDPKTGEPRIETVSAAIKGTGLKHLVKVTIDVDGKGAGRSAHCAILRVVVCRSEDPGRSPSTSEVGPRGMDGIVRRASGDVPQLHVSLDLLAERRPLDPSSLKGASREIDSRFRPIPERGSTCPLWAS